MEVQENHGLLVEKYRPKTLDTYIGNESLKSKVTSYLESGDVPHLLLYGKAGTGKTTLAKIIVNHIDCDYLYINASDENSVDVVREKVKGFASTMGFKDYKIIILDECDYITPNAQAVSIDDSRNASKVKTYINGQQWDYDVLLDPNSSLKRALNFQTVPYTLLIDSKGSIVYTHSGYVEGDEYILEDHIKELE